MEEHNKKKIIRILCFVMLWWFGVSVMCFVDSEYTSNLTKRRSVGKYLMK